MSVFNPTTGNVTGFKTGFVRGYEAALANKRDNEVFDSYEQAVIYAATEVISREGQIISVVANDRANLYLVTPEILGELTVAETNYPIHIKEIGTITEEEVRRIANEAVDENLSWGEF